PLEGELPEGAGSESPRIRHPDHGGAGRQRLLLRRREPAGPRRERGGVASGASLEDDDHPDAAGGRRLLEDQVLGVDGDVVVGATATVWTAAPKQRVVLLDQVAVRLAIVGVEWISVPWMVQLPGTPERLGVRGEGPLALVIRDGQAQHHLEIVLGLIAQV